MEWKVGFSLRSARLGIVHRGTGVEERKSEEDFENGEDDFKPHIEPAGFSVGVDVAAWFGVVLACFCLLHTTAAASVSEPERPRLVAHSGGQRTTVRCC